ncbi:MAG: CPBP family intramembrane glutamic endopeptidase [Chitinophagaceae bacterium]
MKELRYSILILCAVILLLMLRLPLEKALDNYFLQHRHNELISGLLIRASIVIGLCYFMYTRKFFQFAGLSPTFTVNSLWLVLSPLCIIGLIAYANIDTFRQASYSLLLLFGLNAFFTGALEELTLRGMVLSLLLKHYSRMKNPFFKAIFLSSFLFGIAHFIGLIKHPDNIEGITKQVILAIGIGFYLAALFFRTKNIIVPIVIHFLINLAGGVYKLKEQEDTEILTSDSSGLISYVPITVISLILIALGIRMLKRVDKLEWLKKLDLIKV